MLRDGPSLAPLEREGLSVRVQEMEEDLFGLILLRQRAAGFSATEDPVYLSPEHKSKSNARVEEVLGPKDSSFLPTDRLLLKNSKQKSSILKVQ